jgi:hypothetical protein
MGWHEMTAGVRAVTQSTFADRRGTATAIAFEPIGQAAIPVTNAIFRDAHLAVDVETGLQVVSAEPEVSFDLANLPRMPAEGDHVLRYTLDVNGAITATTRYRVTEPMKDGEGGVKLALRRAA